MSEYDVFISYRRELNSEAARLLCHALAGKGLKVFLDVDSLQSGHFDEKLVNTIESTPNFVAVLSKGSLARCRNPGDWVCREIAHAIDNNRNIVPVLMGEFTFEGEDLPEELGSLPRHNGIKYNHEYFGAMIDRLVGCLKLTPRPSGASAPAEARPAPAMQAPDYVFLDFDGVLRPTGSEPYVLNRKCLQRFEALMREHPASRIVITSSWRFAMGLSELRARFSPDIAQRIVGTTPVIDEGDGPDRHQEILHYLKKNKAADATWVALDDEPDRYGAGSERVVATVPTRGFDEAAVAAFRALVAQ